jgi:hypothetical protein
MGMVSMMSLSSRICHPAVASRSGIAGGGGYAGDGDGDAVSKKTIAFSPKNSVA